MHVERTGPLTNLRVIEMCHVMAGPTCGLMLGDMGADVIKLERLPGGDDQRRAVPPKIGTESATFLMVNRSKRGIAVDLKTSAGKDVLWRLIDTADILTENFRKGAMERMGFSFEALHKRNPRLVYCAISGFGRTGPMADHGGYDLVAQGMSGLMSITGEGPGRAPVKVGSPIADVTAGLLAAMGILAAIHDRERTGLGQMVDTSLLEAGIIHTFWQSSIAFATGDASAPMGSAHPLNAPYQAFETSDGWLNLGAANQANWLRTLDVIGRPDLADDPRFPTNAERMGHRLALEAVLNIEFRKRSTDAWLALLEAAGVPAGPVLDIPAMHRHPQVLAREMVVESEHGTVGKHALIGAPIKFSRTPARVQRPAPTYGEHTGEVLQDLGYSPAEIAQMVKEGSIICN